jgi:hypothetical protein
MRLYDKLQMQALEISLNIRSTLSEKKKSFPIELTLRSLKPYSKLRDMDNEGNEIKQLKDGSFQAISFKPFWSTD